MIENPGCIMMTEDRLALLIIIGVLTFLFCLTCLALITYELRRVGLAVEGALTALKRFGGIA